VRRARFKLSEIVLFENAFGVLDIRRRDLGGAIDLGALSTAR